MKATIYLTQVGDIFQIRLGPDKTGPSISLKKETILPELTQEELETLQNQEVLAIRMGPPERYDIHIEKPAESEKVLVISGNTKFTAKFRDGTGNDSYWYNLETQAIQEILPGDQWISLDDL